MAIQKPQFPLTVGMTDPQQIYPLTVAEQVIMEDGTRLNAAIDKFLVPAYTTSDYGKMLTCSEAGLQWAESASVLADVEGVGF